MFHNVSKESEKINIEYSILAKQYALTHDQHNFWANLKKITEQPGMIFGPRPSQSNSNIHCLSNPAEPILGYLCASTTTKKRLFINRSDISYYNYTPFWLS